MSEDITIKKRKILSMEIAECNKNIIHDNEIILDETAENIYDRCEKKCEENENSAINMALDIDNPIFINNKNINSTITETLIISDDSHEDDTDEKEQTDTTKNITSEICNYYNESFEQNDELIKLTFKDEEIFRQVKSPLIRNIQEIFSKLNKSINISENAKNCTICVKDFSDSFMIDTAPGDAVNGEVIDTNVPAYKTAFNRVINNDSKEKDKDECIRLNKNLCFNCNGDHPLRECTIPRDFNKIAQNRKKMKPTTERYHVDNDQKFAHLRPGIISSDLQKALGLKKKELPTYIYRMRIFGYPPGWLEDAKVLTSGLTLFDSQGNEVLKSDDEDGEVASEEVRYDTNKIISYPGFNVLPSTGTYDDTRYHRVPPMQQSQSKELFVQSLQGSIAKAYKRKKLKKLPGSQPIKSEQTESTDMEIEMDNDESRLIFASNNINFVPSMPPLPQTVPARISPPPPPPPTSPPPLPPGTSPPPLPSTKSTPPSVPTTSPSSPAPSPPTSTALPPTSETQSIVQQSSSSIVTPINSSLTIDYENITLEELNANRLKILDDLNNSSILNATLKSTNTDDSLINDIMELEKTKTDNDVDLTESYVSLESSDNMNSSNNSQYIPKETIFGTPLLKQISEYQTTPDGEKWSVGVSDIIDFENLPESTGAYSKMRTLLGKVRSIVKKLNEE